MVQAMYNLFKIVHTLLRFSLPYYLKNNLVYSNPGFFNEIVTVLSMSIDGLKNKYFIRSIM